ncbi:MAG TPA: hypothetical protein VF598_06690 [Hymenobacter sp.]|jgi:hypothetical protein
MKTPPIPSQDDDEQGRIDSPSTKNADATIADAAGDGGQQFVDSSERAKDSPEAGIPESTQENMGDGSGIRGEYGNSDQTNGKEG